MQFVRLLWQKATTTKGALVIGAALAVIGNAAQAWQILQLGPPVLWTALGLSILVAVAFRLSDRLDSLEKRAAVAVTPGAQAPAAPRTRRELYSGSLDGIRSLLQGGKDLLTTAPRDRPEDGAAWQAWATVAEAWFDRVKHHKENATLPAHIRQRYDLPAGKIDEAKLLKGVPPGHQQRIYSVQVIVMALTGAEDGLDHWIITGHN